MDIGIGKGTIVGNETTEGTDVRGMTPVRDCNEVVPPLGIDSKVPMVFKSCVLRLKSAAA
jgi:hypothetical protein